MCLRIQELLSDPVLNDLHKSNHNKFLQQSYEVEIIFPILKLSYKDNQLAQDHIVYKCRA